MKGQSFHHVASAPRRRSVHDLSYQKVFTADFGQLVPIFVEPMIPGDTFRMTSDSVIRFQPLLAPVMHEINATTHYFFVPYRILWEGWEDFITGGQDGDDESTPPTLTGQEIVDNWKKGSLLEYIYDCIPTSLVPAQIDNAPVKLPVMAYNQIYNDYYRDENLIDEIDIETSFKIQNRAWTKDYFTSALPFQQRGVSPSMPIAIENATIEPTIPNDKTAYVYFNEGNSGNPLRLGAHFNNSITSPNMASGTVDAGIRPAIINQPAGHFSETYVQMDQIAQKLKVDLNVISDWDINDLRTAWQTQRFLEAMARVGARYTEYLRGIWNVTNGDNTLQRPEYIGGTRQPVVISEVLQTSETTNDDNPLGRMGGHGISANSTRVGSYTAREWGICIGIMSVMPRPSYHQGIDKRFLAKTRWDYPVPYFMHLSEQPITKGELYYTGRKSMDDANFGFQGIWDEYRIKHDSINGLIRDDFAHWSLSRTFGSQPSLSKEFIECDAITGGALNPLKRIFQVPSEPGLIITTGTRCTAIRPIPFVAEPGLVDH